MHSPGTSSVISASHSTFDPMGALATQCERSPPFTVTDSRWNMKLGRFPKSRQYAYSRSAGAFTVMAVLASTMLLSWVLSCDPNAGVSLRLRLVAATMSSAVTPATDAAASAARARWLLDVSALPRSARSMASPATRAHSRAGGFVSREDAGTGDDLAGADRAHEGPRAARRLRADDPTHHIRRRELRGPQSDAEPPEAAT